MCVLLLSICDLYLRLPSVLVLQPGRLRIDCSPALTLPLSLFCCTFTPIYFSGELSSKSYVHMHASIFIRTSHPAVRSGCGAPAHTVHTLRSVFPLTRTHLERALSRPPPIITSRDLAISYPISSSSLGVEILRASSHADPRRCGSRPRM